MSLLQMCREPDAMDTDAGALRGMGQRTAVRIAQLWFSPARRHLPGSRLFALVHEGEGGDRTLRRAMLAYAEERADEPHWIMVGLGSC